MHENKLGNGKSVINFFVVKGPCGENENEINFITSRVNHNFVWFPVVSKDFKEVKAEVKVEKQNDKQMEKEKR